MSTPGPHLRSPQRQNVSLAPSLSSLEASRETKKKVQETSIEPESIPRKTIRKHHKIVRVKGPRTHESSLRGAGKDLCCLQPLGVTAPCVVHHQKPSQRFHELLLVEKHKDFQVSPNRAKIGEAGSRVDCCRTAAEIGSKPRSKHATYGKANTCLHHCAETAEEAVCSSSEALGGMQDTKTSKVDALRCFVHALRCGPTPPAEHEETFALFRELKEVETSASFRAKGHSSRVRNPSSLPSPPSNPKIVHGMSSTTPKGSFTLP